MIGPEVLGKKPIFATYRKFDERLIYLKRGPSFTKTLQEFKLRISTSSISTILSEVELAWKVLERRAIQIQIKNVLRFCNALSSLLWFLENLVFMDEVGFDNKSMMRKKAYAIKGRSLIKPSEFIKKPRISLL